MQQLTVELGANMWWGTKMGSRSPARLITMLLFPTHSGSHMTDLNFPTVLPACAASPTIPSDST